jgi:hypothetical protein
LRRIFDAVEEDAVLGKEQVGAAPVDRTHLDRRQ